MIAKVRALLYDTDSVLKPSFRRHFNTIALWIGGNDRGRQPPPEECTILAATQRADSTSANIAQLCQLLQPGLSNSGVIKVILPPARIMPGSSDPVYHIFLKELHRRLSSSCGSRYICVPELYATADSFFPNTYLYGSTWAQGQKVTDVPLKSKGYAVISKYMGALVSHTAHMPMIVKGVMTLQGEGVL